MKFIRFLGAGREERIKDGRDYRWIAARSNVTKFFELVGVDKRLNEGIKRLRVVY